MAEEEPVNCLEGTDQEKFLTLCNYPFAKQCIWFLNAYWVKVEGGPVVFKNNDEECELLFSYFKGMSEECPEKDKGHELDEFQAHKFLEKQGQTMTVVEMRAVMKEIDINFDRKVSMMEFLIYHYKMKGFDWIINSPQSGDDPATLKAAAALEEALKDLDDLNALQKANDQKMKDLELASTNSELGIVARSRAKAELAQMKAADPIPLSRARITAGASVRKCEKILKQVAAENAGGAFGGEIWWMQRELEEAKKYMSKSQIAKLEGKK